MQRLVSATIEKLGLQAIPTAVIFVRQASAAREQDQLTGKLLAEGWPEGSVFAFDFSGSAQMPPGVRPVPEDAATSGLLRRLAFFSEPEELPYLAAPVILLGLWKDGKAESAVFAYPGLSAERVSAARQMIERGCEAVLLRSEDEPPAVIALAHNARNERMLTHWVDLLDHFSSNPKQREPFDRSLPGEMIESVCDCVGSIRQPLALVAARKEAERMNGLVRNAVREILPEFPELSADPFGNALRCLNAPSAKVPQDPGNLITNFVHFIWSTRSDLPAAFDLSTSEGRRGFVDWLFSRAPVELDLGDEYLNPIRMERENPLLTVAAPKEIAVEKPVSASEANTGVNLVGYPRAEMGMGELLRQSAAGFSTTSVPFFLVDFNFGLIASQSDARYEHLVRTDNPYATNLFHINADQMRVAREQLGPEFFRDHYNIGYWAWELSNFPDEWRDAIDLVDEIWAPSRFVQKAISKATTKPVVWMPLPVEFPEPDGQGRHRERFGLPEDRFLFLFTFDFSSFAARKNFRGCIEAFHTAFPESEEASLVIKTIRHPHHKREFWDLLRAIGDDRRIFLIDRVLRRPELHELMAACDSFVSLHRSEGFGLGVAEAMYLGKPVIATNYSGNVDFTKPENSCLVDYRLVPVKPGEYLFPEGQVWADPNLDQGAMYMRRLVDDRDYAKQLGAAAAEFIRRQHSTQAAGKRYAQRLKQITSARALLGSTSE
jgi:glycosyltransferase involved in cell wall biosynthesis